MQNFDAYSRLAVRLACRNLIRHYAKSLLSAAIGVLTVLLLVIYAANIASTRDQLVSLPEAVEVTARISNLNGSMDAGLSIPEKTVDGIKNLEEAEDVVLTVQLMAGFGEFTPEEWRGNLNYFVAGINDIAGVPGLKKEELLFEDQADESIFTSREPVCIIDEWVMEQNGLKLGDEVPLNIFYYRYEGHEIYNDPLTLENYRIVGAMDMKEYTGSTMAPDILLPFENVRDIFHEKGFDFTADSVSFKVKDPFRLNECKSRIHDLGLLPVVKDADYWYDGNAITMKDDMFINTAENLRETMAILTGMLPFVIIIMVFVGYLCSYLLIQSRKAEYATMRSVGMGWGYCFLVMFLENILIEVSACAAASLPVLLVGGVSVRALLLSDIVFLLSFLAGSAGALWSFHSLSVMEVLRAV